MSPIHLIFWLLCTGDVHGEICFLIQQTRRNIEKWCFLLIALDLPFSLCNSDSHLISHMLIDCGKSLLNRHPNLHDFFCKTFKYLIRSYTPSAWPSQFCQKKHFNFAEKYNREWTANSFNNQYLGKKKTDWKWIWIVSLYFLSLRLSCHQGTVWIYIWRDKSDFYFKTLGQKMQFTI